MNISPRCPNHVDPLKNVRVTASYRFLKQYCKTVFAYVTKNKTKKQDKTQNKTVTQKALKTKTKIKTKQVVNRLLM